MCGSPFKPGYICRLTFLQVRQVFKNKQRRSIFMGDVHATKDLKGSVMVVGGGIAGMQSALDLANSGFYVYMIEKSPAIGGVMAQLDKTFPTNDCSM
jgi:heterodisulfide reductase subunit A-like polyferredoxin